MLMLHLSEMVEPKMVTWVGQAWSPGCDFGRLGVGREEAEWIQPFHPFQKRRQPDPREASDLWNLEKDLRGLGSRCKSWVTLLGNEEPACWSQAPLSCIVKNQFPCTA